jgi:hypothetical protein
VQNPKAQGPHPRPVTHQPLPGLHRVPRLQEAQLVIAGLGLPGQHIPVPSSPIAHIPRGVGGVQDYRPATPKRQKGLVSKMVKLRAL